jgi:hypothetical protein
MRNDAMPERHRGFAAGEVSTKGGLVPLVKRVNEFLDVSSINIYENRHEPLAEVICQTT